MAILVSYIYKFWSSLFLQSIGLFAQEKLKVPRTGSSPDLERYPKANAASSAESVQQIIGWKTFFTLEGSLKTKRQLKDHGSSLVSNDN